MSTTATISRKGIGGPKTDEGKRRVSLNALKHGLDAKSPQAQVTITQAVGVTYEEVLSEMRQYYQPADPIEELLIQRIARCSWRIMITQAMEDRHLEQRMHLSISKRYEKILRFERLVDIQLHRAIAALARKRAERDKKTEQNKLNPDPAPSSAHAQQNGEFVPPNNYKSPSPVPTVNSQPPTLPSPAIDPILTFRLTRAILRAYAIPGG